MKKSVYLFGAVFFAFLLVTRTARTQSSPNGDAPDEIDVTAKTFDFTPSEIHVKKGERVKIRLRSADRAHGLNLNIYPLGAAEDGNPGLVFDHQQDNAKVEKGKDRVIEFIAARTGTYDFKCSVQCSMFGHGHDKMTGKLIVEE